MGYSTQIAGIISGFIIRTKQNIGGRALERRASAADGVTVTNGLSVGLGLFTVGPAPIRMSAGGRLSRYVAITS